MPARPLYLGTDVLQRARDLEFRQRADRDIWQLGFSHQAESDINSLSKLIEPPQLELQAAPEQEPLPIVVSDRPDALALQRQAQERQAAQQPMMQPQQQASELATVRTSMPVAMDAEGQRMPTSERAANVPAAGGEYRAYARQVAQAYGLDPDIFERQINQESGFQPWGADGKPLGSPAGAQGIAQFMPGTAASYGVDVNDPYSSLEGAARHMRDLLRANNGNYRLALAAYNAGQGNVDKYGEGVFGDDFAHGETKRYVQNILGGGAPDMPRLSLNAAPADAPGRAAPPAPAGVSSAPAGAPPAPWEMAGAQDGAAPLMLKENDETAPMGGGDAMLPGDGGYAPTPEYDSRAVDEGPRESRPAPIMPTDPTVTDPAYTQSPTGMTYGPIQQGEVQGPAVPAPQNQIDRYVPNYQAQAAQVAPTMPSPAAGAVQAGIDAGVEAYNDPFFQAGPQPPRWVKIVSDAMQAFGAESAKNVARSLGVTDEEWFNVFGYPISRVDVAGFAGGMAADPTNYVGLNAADPLVTVARGAVRDFAPEAVKNVGRAVGSTLREGAESLGRGLQGVGREVAGGLMDLNPAMTPRIIGDGPGIGRAMAEGAGEAVAPVPSRARERRVMAYRNPNDPKYGLVDTGRRERLAEGEMDAVREVNLANADYLGAVRQRTDAEATAARFPDDPDAQRALMDAVYAEEQAKSMVDAAREWLQMVRTGDKTLATPGVSPGPRGAGIGTQLATDAGNALAGSMVGAVAPADTPEERLRNTALGAAGFPIAGRLMRRAGGALGTPGIGPNGRPQQRTVEWLAEQIDYTKRVLDDLDPATEGELIGQVQDRLARLQGEWVDAVNARRALEPRIRSEVGRRVNELPIDERTASDYAGIGRERVSPEAGVPTTVDDTPRSPGLNSAIPGFDPGAAALGAGAGLEEDGEMDPLRTAAGVFVAGLGNSRYGRRFIANAARNAQPGPPPNLWEIMQGTRFSWGMLGNFSTGLVNAAGAPVEIALGLPTEAVRMGVMRGRPLAVVNEAVELAGGLKDGARQLLATVLGDIPPSVRNAPDFRPPLSERMAGTMGRIGNVDTGAVVGEVIDLPGRITSQAPDAFWRPVLLQWGRAREAANIAAERGVSKLDPAAQWQELQRLKNSPTPDESQRMTEAAQKWADEMGYKGAEGYWEGALKGIFRPRGRITTSADPVAQQIHEALGSFAMPFLGAVAKLHKLAATRAPGAGFIANRSLPMDEKAARQLVGGATIYMLADYAAQGMITGPGPADPDEAAIVNKKMPPHSTYVPGVGWVPNDTFGSAGPYLNAIGGYYDSRRYQTDKEKATPGKADEAAVKYVLRGFERFPIAQAAQSVIAMIESPVKGISDFAANVGSSFVPAPYRTYQASQDQYARSVDREAGMDGGFAPALAEQTRQKIVGRAGYVPGLGAREDLPPALDRFGRPIENERQGVSAFLPRVSNPKDDVLTDIFTRAGIEPGMPPTEVDKIPLTTEQKREWLRVRGESLAQKQDILSRAADYPEVRRKNVFEAQMSLASDRAAQAVRRMFTPEQRAAARKKAS